MSEPAQSYEPKHPSRWRNLAISTGLAFLILLALNYAAGRVTDRWPTNRGYWLVEQKFSLLGSIPEGDFALVLGDSSCNQGVVPQVLGEHTDVPIYNLCTMGGLAAVDSAWMLRELQQAGRVPTFVVLVHVYDVWHRAVDPYVLGKVPRQWGYWNPLLPLSKGQMARVGMSRYAPLYAESASLSQLLLTAADPSTELPSFTLDASGYMRMDVSPLNAEEDAKRHRERLPKLDPKPSRSNLAALEAIVELAAAESLDIYAFNSPLYENYAADAAFQAYYADLLDELGSATQGAPNFRWTRDLFVLPASELEGIDHATHSAAVAYTEFIASKIASDPPPGWREAAR